MQAIETKFVSHGRVKATCQRGSITIDADGLNRDDAHVAAADALCKKFVAEDEVKYGTTCNPWARRHVMGVLKDGRHVHVFVD